MIAWSDFPAGSHRVRCPACAKERRNDKTLGVTIHPDGTGVAHCYRCSLVQTHRPTQAPRPARRPRPAPAPAPARPAPTTHPRLSAQGLALWSECLPVAGAALAYLQARRCRIPPADGHLRWHPRLRHPSGYTGPALVALITDTLTREPLSLHKTWVLADGRKAELDSPRLLLAGHRKRGGVIRLWPDEAVTTGLGVAEGIESALSLAWAFVPVWACIDAGNLAALPVLNGIEALTIAADNDPAGQAAAQTCATRWAAAGRAVWVTRQRDNDLNDLVQGVAA
jgi:hypothetical protein